MSSFRSQLDGWNNSLRGGEHFPDPFMDMASTAMPDQHKNVLDWCEFIFMSNGTYRMAMERIISYFLTDIEIGSPGDDTIGDDEKEKYSTYLKESLDGLTVLQSLTRDRMCYGNGFASVVVPFHRMVVCPKCGTQHPLRVVLEDPKFKWSWANCEPSALCQNTQCGQHGKWKFNDIPNTEDSKIKIKRWNPKEIEIVHDYYTDETAYLWRIPEDYRQKVIKGELFTLERCPQQMIQAVKKRQLFRFADDAVFHMKEPTLAGIKTRGWGISRVLTNFRQAWYVQVLRRYNEAIALDYVIPFRVITPAEKSGNGMNDPLMSMGGGNMRGEIMQMLAKRRRDPAAWHTLSFPVQYQALGGEATALAPKDLLDQGQQTLLNETGTPMELFQGTLSMQAAPVALRLFESTWQHLVHDNDRFLTWLVKQLSQILSWETVTAKLRRVTYADDMNRQMAALQLAMGQQLSQTTALKGMGFSWRDEQRQIAEEARFQSEMQANVQEEMEQSAYGSQIAKGQGGQPGAPAQGGQPAPGGDPSQPQGPPPGPVTGMLQSPDTPTTPQDLLAQADSLAQQMFGLPESQKDSELRALKQKNEVLHSLVKAKMQQYRQKAQTAGGSQVLAQQFGGGAPPQ